MSIEHLASEVKETGNTSEVSSWLSWIAQNIPASAAAGRAAPRERGEPDADASGYVHDTPNLGKARTGKGKCNGHWAWRKCGCGSKPVYIGGCGRRNCPLCGPGRRDRQVNRVSLRFEAGHVKRVQLLVLTVPPPLREQFKGGAGADRWASVVGDFLEELENGFGMVFAYARSHPTGDDGVEWHPHVNIAWVQREGFSGKLDVGVLRRIWSRCLGLGVTGSVDLHVSYADLESDRGRARWIHWLQYVERPFPGWNWAGCRSRWFGKYPRGLADRGAHSCPLCQEQYRLEMMSRHESALTWEQYRAGTLEGWHRGRDGQEAAVSRQVL